LTRPKRAGIPTVEQLPGGPNLEALHTVYEDRLHVLPLDTLWR
jgi:hypothetical protein